MTSLFLCTVFCLIFSVSVHAQLEPPSLSDIDKKIEALGSEPKSEEGKLLESLKELRSAIKQNTASEQKLESLKFDIEQLPIQLEAVRVKLTAMSDDKRVIDSSLDLEAIKQLMAESTEDLNVAKTELATLMKSELERNNRDVIIPDILSKLNIELIEIGDSGYPNALADPLDISNYHLTIAKKKSLKINIETLKTEQLYNENIQELTDAKRLLLNKRTLNQTAYIESLQPILQKSVDVSTQDAQVKVESRVAQFKNIPEIIKYAEEIAEYSELKNTLSLQLAEVQSLERTTSALLTKTKNQYFSARSRIELIESSDFDIDTETGELLRLQRAQLETPEKLRKLLETNSKRSIELQLEELKLDNLLQTTLLDSEAIANKLVEENGLSSQEGIEITEMLKQHRNMIQSVNQHYDKMVQALHSFNNVTKESISEIEAYSLYLDERLLWIPSAPVINFSEVKVEMKSLIHLTTKNLPEWTTQLIRDASKMWLYWLICLVILFLILIRRKRYKEVLIITADIVTKGKCTKSLPTFQSLWVSFLIALPIPLICGFLAWRGETPSSVSQGLKYITFFLGVVGIMKVFLHPRGLLVAHLGLEERYRMLMTKHISWFYLTIPILLFTAISLHTELLYPQSGRIIFVVMMLIVLVFFHTIFKPSKGLLKKDNNQLFTRFIYFIVVSIPLLFIVGECMGYITSVQTIRLQLVSTGLLILVAFLFSKIGLRLTLNSRRRLAKEQAKKKYKAIRAAKALETTNNEIVKGETTISLDEIEAEAVNIVAVEEQTKRMVRVVMVLFIAFGVWNIWCSTLPALSILDNVKFGKEKIENVVVPNTDSVTDTLMGKPKSDKSIEVNPIVLDQVAAEDTRTTLKEVLWAMALVGMTVVFSRNLPGLIEMLILRRLKLKEGGNYAVTTILRYSIVLIGALLIFGQLGVTWSSVQWLAAAVTLGIGFGLQEIFANFVAGIILLFERPVRLGDVVTVGEFSGKITQINIRATTIQQFNNRELVVPNKEFITGQLINWTLSDNLLRFEFYVGIAYGSDTQKATDVINEIMDNHPKISKEPPTDISFKAFGNSTLDFRVRGYVRTPEESVRVPSDLHYEIDRRFREEEIEIAFPQTDIHIRTLPDSINLKDVIKLGDEKKD